MAIVYAVTLEGPSGYYRYSTGAGFVDADSFYYDPRIIQPGLLRTEIRIDGIFGGRASVSIGEIVLANADGGLDSLHGVAFDGRSVTIAMMDDATGLPEGQSIFAKIKTVRFDWKTVSVVIQDPAAQLAASPLHAFRYAGNNVLPNGTEGTAADVQDLVKPILFGNKTNLPAVLVNTSKLIYQVAHDLSNALSVTGVYVGGAALTNAGAASPNINDAAAPAAGTFITDTNGRFRLGSTPTLRVTCNAQQTMGLGTIIQRIAENGSGLSFVDSGSVSAANTAYPSSVSPFFFSNAEKTVGEALDEVCSGYGYVWTMASGVFSFAKFTAPSGSPVLSLDADNIIDIDIADSGDVPIKRVTCRYDKNLAVMERNELAGSLSEASIQAFGLDYKKQSASTTSTHLTAGEYVFEANTGAGGTALDLANERLSLQSVDRLVLRVTCNMQSIFTPPLLAVVKVTLPRFGMQAGKLFRTIAVEHDWRRNQLELTLWG
jgi:hypothetical protein